MAPDSIALEIAVARLDGGRWESFNKIWQKADVQSLPLDVRKRLDRNGFRFGLLGNQLPSELSECLSWSRPLLTDAGEVLYPSKSALPPVSRSEAYVVKQIEQIRAGDEHWVPCSAWLPQLSWRIDDDHGDSRSGVCEQARCGFMLSHSPVGDHSIQLWLRPMIRYGQSRRRYGVDENTLLMREQQKRLRIRELDVEQNLRLGQTLVVTTHDVAAGLGQSFFSPGPRSSGRHVLLIRLLQVRQNDLFAPERTSRRLSTSLD